jgi:hypothetical protein
VAVKHHQQPAAPKIGQLVLLSISIRQVKTESWFAGQVIHGGLQARGTSQLWFGTLNGLLALNLVLVIGRVAHPVETLLSVGRVHGVLIALLPLLLLEAGVPTLIGTSWCSKAECDDKHSQKICGHFLLHFKVHRSPHKR